MTLVIMVVFMEIDAFREISPLFLIEYTYSTSETLDHHVYTKRPLNNDFSNNTDTQKHRRVMKTYLLERIKAPYPGPERAIVTRITSKHPTYSKPLC